MRRLITLLLLAAAPTLAQCVMCFRTAAAQQTARALILNKAILILGVPPFLILAGFVVLAFKRSGAYRDEQDPDQS